MTLFYKTYSWSQGDSGIPEETRMLWEHVANKKNWRIVQLPNGFYQAEHSDYKDQEVWHDTTRRETLKGAEAAIDGSIDHYTKKLEFMKGPKIVKTFK